MAATAPGAVAGVCAIRPQHAGLADSWRAVVAVATGRGGSQPRIHSAFVGVDGVAGWLLAHAGAQAAAGLRAGLVDGLTTLFSAALVGVLALVGVVGWLIAALAVTAESTAELRRLVPAGLLVLSALALGFSHAPPVGPVGAGFGLVAAILLDVLTAWQPERVGSAAGGS